MTTTNYEQKETKIFIYNTLVEHLLSVNGNTMIKDMCNKKVTEIKYKGYSFIFKPVIFGGMKISLATDNFIGEATFSHGEYKAMMRYIVTK